MQKFCSVKEAALRVGRSERAVWLAIYRKQFPHRRWGHRVLISVDELEKFLQELPGVTAEEARVACEAR